MLKYTLPEELQKLINYIQNKLIKEFPINNITLNYILLAILDKHESDGYQVLSKLLMSTDLKDFKEYVSELVLIDSNKDLSTGDDYSYSSDYYDIMDSKIDDNIVGSCRFLINCISKNKNIKDYLKKLGVTIEQLKTFVVDYHTNKISTQNKIKEMIATNYQVGERLPSIMQLSKMMDLSPNTIRKAFKNLAKEGYICFTRGRYGGTFVLDIPEMENEQTFKWLAVSQDYIAEKV
jgi:DNA-binding transcriptional regulator YhcF (GntR family)